jgi:chromate transporter
MPGIPTSETPWRLFVRFLRFGSLAWGGPVAQIGMLRAELVDDEQWIPSARFNRVLAVYQALPGPEAHELCVYFGSLAHGRLGGLLAGLGFMLPGFGLMLLASWAYLRWGMTSPVFAAALLGCQPAVVALIVRATVRIASHALSSRTLWAIAVASAAATWGGVNFLVVLALAGVAGALAARQPASSALSAVGPVALVPLVAQTAAVVTAPGIAALFGYGLRAGLLTFGGAYTAIPLLQHDAVVRGAWMTNAQFLDGIALSGLLPAPLVIFATFVGYVGGGFAGAFAITAGVFAPAFAFTLIGHRHVERLVDNTAAHAALDGITAGVVGIIAVTALRLFGDVVTAPIPVAIFGVALLLAFRWRARLAVAGIMLGAALTGWLMLGATT